MSGLVGGSKLRSKFRGVWLQPLQHVTQHFQSQWQSCRLVVNGSLEALETLDGKSQHRVPGCRALVHKGVVQEGDCCHIHLYGPRVHGLAEVDCKPCSGGYRGGRGGVGGVRTPPPLPSDLMMNKIKINTLVH